MTFGCWQRGGSGRWLLNCMANYTAIRYNGVGGLPMPHTRKTHCPRGHLFDEANTRIRRNGERQCRICNRAAEKARRAGRPFGKHARPIEEKLKEGFKVNDETGCWDWIGVIGHQGYGRFAVKKDGRW